MVEHGVVGEAFGTTTTLKDKTFSGLNLDLMGTSKTNKIPLYFYELIETCQTPSRGKKTFFLSF